MDFKHSRRTNTAYIKTVDLQLNGNQISLSERPSPKELVKLTRARSLRPCCLRRPMSATPSFGYRNMSRNKKMPPWSRPQSAGGLRRTKMAAKFSHHSLQDSDYCPDLGATYTLSSSQLLHSLMGSCSLGEGLDSDTTPTPSPQPSLGDTIRAAAQLEPGLTAKPPLPPVSTPTPTAPPATVAVTDDLIALKFQRWFPDSILESEILQRAALKEETDHSDSGSEVSDKENNKNQSLEGNFSTFVKRKTFPKSNNEVKKSSMNFSNNSSGRNGRGKKSPKIVVHTPDPYGCDVVTEEFASEPNAQGRVPPDTSLKKSNNFVKGKNYKYLSLTDLNDIKTEVRSHSVNVFSDSEIYKNNDLCAKGAQLERYSDSELYRDEKENAKAFPTPTQSRIEGASPLDMDASATNYRYTSTPVTNEDRQTKFDNLQETDNTSYKNDCDSNDPMKLIYNIDIDSNYNHQLYNSYDSNHVSPPIKLKAGGQEIYNDNFSLHNPPTENIPSRSDKNESDTLFVENNYGRDCTSKTKTQEKHAHFTNEVKPFNQSFETEQGQGISSTYTNKDLGNWTLSREQHLSTIAEKGIISQKINTKHGSLENVNKGFGRKNNRPGKEMGRAASVPPYPNSKLPVALARPLTKQKAKRSMSYDGAAVSDISEKDSGVSSYEDIVTMIKVLEKEDLASPVLKYKTSPEQLTLDSSVAEQSSSAKAILNFLDEVERGSMITVETDRPVVTGSAMDSAGVSSQEPPASSRLGTLLNTDSAALAQQVMSLTLQLEDKSAVCKAFEERYRQSVDLLEQQKAESEQASRRHQKFIDQLLKEKRQLAVQYETAIREMEGKHETVIKTVEERHKVEMKKAQEKFNAAEKIRRDKWIDTKTKKIKELTVRGLEPELERMAAGHQEELAELRRVHQRQLTEAEAMFNRRASALREQEATERQAAVMHEREASRHRLEQEMNQVEKSYQEQRRRLLEEVRQEKELLQRQSERLIAEKQTDIARQVDEAKRKLQAKLTEYDKQHQEEIVKLKESVEAEKQAWLNRQKSTLEEKEAALREELKRERDRHIELVIRRLEGEAAAKEQAIENKLKRLKESYDAEVNDLDSTLKELRARLKEARADLQRSEDNNAALAAQLSQAQNELLPLKQTIEKLQKDYNETKKQNDSKIVELQSEITGGKQSFQDQVNKIHNEKEKQLQEVYTRVKVAISKKEEALSVVTRQRDTALEQCTRLEKLLETKRNQALKL